MNRVMHYALLPAFLALVSGCGGGGSDTTACNLAAGAVGGVPGGCLGAGGGGGAVGVGVVTPVALADAASTNEDSALLLEVTNNDSSGTGDTVIAAVGVTVFSVSGSGGVNPTNGVAVITDGAGGLVTYTPDAGFTGTDTFSYTLQDANGATATALVTVTVLAGLNPISATGTLEGLTERASFRTTSAAIGGLPSESALLTRDTTDSRITIGPLADPSFDFDVLLGTGGGLINADVIATYVGGFSGTDGTLNYWSINLDAASVAHGALGPILIPSAHPHAPFDVDDPATAFVENLPANFAAQSTHFTRLALTIPGPEGSTLSFAGYGLWEVEGPNVFGTGFVGSAFSFGVLTAAGAVPTTGNAIYNGTMRGLFSPTPGTAPNALSTLAGTATLTADFAAQTLAASFTGITATSNFGPVARVNGGLAGSFVDISATATIANNGFTGVATTVATTGAAIAPLANGLQLMGEIDGNFFGPAAEEAGGVIRLGNPSGAHIVGGFAGTR